MDSFVPRTPGRAFVWYALLSVVFTWPVVAGLTRDVPRDLGDPLLNCWILGWNADHFLRALGGDVGALATLWHGNIFHPERYALAYSELLIAQSVQILPIYALTKNLILCYNLLFLSTFALSALGMFLLARAYTGDWRVAFVAGLLFGFLPYRVNQASHLQVMSSQWMPFALYGFHRFIATRRPLPLLGGALALVAQNLSCGYFLVYFSLFVPPFVLFEIVRQRRVRDWRVWTGLAAAAVAVAVATLPFMQPYLALRDLRGTKRTAGEIAIFSADAWSWLTAEPQLALWGTRLQPYPSPEGHLFPGALPIALVGVALVAATWRALRATAGPPGPPGRAAATDLIRDVCVSPLTFALLAFVAAWYLSLGPGPRSAGRPIFGPAVYPWLLAHVPGMDGLRVPARFAMIAVLFLSLAAAFGVRDLLSARRRHAGAVAAALSLLWLVETWSAPFPVNGSMPSDVPGVLTPPSRVAPGPRPPALYRALQGLPADAVLIEFPFGVVAWELRYVYYSTAHWRRLVNGFSGYAPEAYTNTVGALRNPYADEDRAWRYVVESGATHLVVHGQAYLDQDPPAPQAWLERQGARLLRRIGTDTIYAVPGTAP